MRTLVIVLGMVWLLGGRADAVVIVSCGQDVPSGEDGLLIADLSCGSNGLGVHLGRNTRLRLNGHTIQGGAIGVYTHAGRTEIEGPGAIVGAAQVGIFAPNNEGRHRMFVRDGVDLSGHAWAAIALGQANTVRLMLDDVDIHDNAGGAVADCTGLRIKASDLRVADNGAGLCADNVRLRHSSVSNNTGVGIAGKRVRLIDSSVTDNDSTNGWDIGSVTRPRLRGTSSCGHSVVAPSYPGLPNPGSPSWGVCAGD